MILDANGNPIEVAKEAPAVKTTKKSGTYSMFHDISDWQRSLMGTAATPAMRARNPFQNHPWVFAAAMITAIVASQAPFRIFRETDAEVERRRRTAKKHGYAWRGPRRGRHRMALKRHFSSTKQRLFNKGLEADVDHPVAQLLANPNPLQTESQLFQSTHIWLAVRGECFWVKETEDGESPLPGEVPARVWPLSPDLFEPILSDGWTGDLVGWRFQPTIWMNKRLRGVHLDLPLTDVIQFKYPNPHNPLRGLSRLGASADSVAADLMTREYNKQIIENGGDPGGILSYDSTLDHDDEEAYLEKWRQRHEGSYNAKRTALLSGGFKYTPVALTPKDLEYLESQKWNRDEILAAMGTPRSVLGITEYINFATQLGQDKNFWDKTILPMMQMIEQDIDSELMFESPDNIMGAFDTSEVESLRAGIQEKIDMAEKMAQSQLHVPPRTAYEVVGLEVPEYEGDEVAVASIGIGPITLEEDDFDDPFEDPEEDPFEEDEDEDEPVDEDDDELDDDADTDEETEEGELARSVGTAIRSSAVKKVLQWETFAGVQEGLEGKFRKSFRAWVGAEKRIVLSSFDNASKGLLLHQKVIDSFTFLPPVLEAKLRLKRKTRPQYTKALEDTMELSVEDLGIPVFEIDDPLIMDYFNQRETKFVGTTPENLWKNLQKTISEGIAQGETVQQLRIRIAQVFDVARSSSKTLQVARTETASFMNGVRDRMFELNGLSKQQWVTAGDEHVRESHLVFGNAGPKDRGFDYLQLSGGAGSLRYPGDLDAPAGEVINCRCIMIPAEG